MPLDGGLVINDGGHIVNDGGHIINDGGHVINDGGHVTNDGGHIINDGGHIINDGGHVINDGGHAINDGGHIINDGGHIINDGGHIINDGGVEVIDGGVEVIDGGVEFVDGGIQFIDGGVACPVGYVRVPGTALPDGRWISPFCVMKYEAKDDGTGQAVSTPTGQPWVNLTWVDANSACIASGGALILDDQWLAIANDVSSQPDNWTGGSVGIGSLFVGNSENSVVFQGLEAGVDGDGYFGTTHTYPSNQRRTLTLSNGDIIWDVAGNVREWTSQTIGVGNRFHGGTGGWMSYGAAEPGFPAATNVPPAMLPPSGWGSAQGMGRYYDGVSPGTAYNNSLAGPDGCIGNCAAIAAFQRGGGFHEIGYAGVFELDVQYGRGMTSIGVGFRCVGQ